jgi:hypothetical protein
MTKSSPNTSTRTATHAQGNTSKGSRSASRRGRNSSRSASRLGGTGHVEVIPFRPHYSWWVQLLLLVWRWTSELLLVALAVWYWRRTSQQGWPGGVQLAVPVVVVTGLLAWSWSRRWVLGMFWLLVTRHRLRQYFLQCGAYNRAGRLPWLTLSYPTPVGERVWVWLVAGLSLTDFETDTAQIAVACWARDCRVGRSKRLAGLVWVDVIRRDPLTASQPYPSTLLHTDTAVPMPTNGQLADLDDAPVPVVSAGSGAAEAPVVRLARQDGPLDVPRTVIDLDALRPGPVPSNGTGRRNGKPAAKRTTADAGADGATAPVTPIVGRGGEDVSDWL